MIVSSKAVIFILLSVMALGAFVYIATGQLGDNLVYYWDVPQLLNKGQAAYGANIRLGGVVVNKSVHWDNKGGDLTFQIAMHAAAKTPQKVSVLAVDVPPQMFREGIGVLLEGTYNGRVFHADRVLVKHSNEYRPPSEGKRPAEVYRTLIEKTQQHTAVAP